jgi:hypothetical protein
VRHEQQQQKQHERSEARSLSTPQWEEGVDWQRGERNDFLTFLTLALADPNPPFRFRDGMTMATLDVTQI